MSELTAEDLGRVHLIGCGGVGMSGLSEMLLDRGIPVSGSELREWPSLARLRELGATVHMTHSASNVDDVDTVVYSTAIPSDHIELAEARRRGLRVLHRSEALAVATRGRKTIAVAGTCGKTTTTAMTITSMRQCGIDLPFVVGGEILGVGGGADGTSEYFAIEADESDRSFLNYTPHVVVVTNIGHDHLDTYGDIDRLQAEFLTFCRRIEPGGFLVTCADDPRCRELAAAVRAEGITVHTYGEAADADLRVSDLAPTTAGVRYLAHLDGEPLGEVTLPVPGTHLGLNSAAALLAASRLGLPASRVIEGLSVFPGVRRRFELKGVAGGVRVYDDYAGHHKAMTASLRTLRGLVGDGQLIAVCQPCRAYRIREFQGEIADALGLADQVVVMSVYGPGETIEPGRDGISLARFVPLPAAAKTFVWDWAEVPAEVVRRARPGDLVVTLGAPGMALMADALLDALDKG